jgi:adenylate cyclase
VRSAADPPAGAAALVEREAMPARKRFRISLTVTILAAFSMVFVTVIGFTAVAAYRQSMRTAVALAVQAMADVTARTAARTAALVEPLYATIAIPPVLPDISLGAGAATGETEASFRRLLTVLPEARAVTAARADGALLQVLDLDAMAPARRLALALPDGARLAVRSVTTAIGGDRQEVWRYLDSAGHVLEQRKTGPANDPRGEVWFRTAMNSEGIATTVLHMFPVLGVPGLSIVRRMPQDGVLCIDVALGSLGGFLAEQRVSPRSSAFMIDDNGILIAHSDRSIAMSSDPDGDMPSWVTIASSTDPILHAVWANFATGRLAPGRDVTLSVGGEDYLARIVPLGRIGTPPFLVAVVAPVTDFTATVEHARNWTLLLFLAAGAVGLGLITFVAHRITKPLADLTREADAIRRFDLERPLTVSSHITEVARLAATMHAMKDALHLFGLYVPKYLVRQLVSGDGGGAKLGGERRQVTVMFTDIVGFTTIADGMDPEQLTQLTSDYFERMTRELMGAGGTIDKYVGDAIMTLWNAPSPDDEHAAHACLAALRCRTLSDRIEQDFAQRGWPALRTRFGVNTGEAVLGNVGSSDRMSYTAIGAMVNMASRLEGLNKQYLTQILVTEATRAAAGADFVFRHVDRVLPKGRQVPTDIHELLGLRCAAGPMDEALVLGADDIAWASDWDRLVAAYLDRRFVDAQRLLQSLPARRNDALRDLFAQRIEALIARPASDDWVGVTAYQEK